MVRRAGDDKLEGKFGSAQRTTPASRQSLPGVSGNKRQRAAWFNRARGQGGVKLKVERPAGSQRVIVKIKPVVHTRVGGDRGGGAGSLMRHTLYVEREGAGREGDAVSVFDAEHDRADGAAFVARCEDDRHHFRVIISPEYGEDFVDLKSYTRELVDQVGRDLHTRLDWIASPAPTSPIASASGLKNSPPASLARVSSVGASSISPWRGLRNSNG
jgi:hypothetical protein